MAGASIDASHLRADIIAYVLQPTGLRKLWGRFITGVSQAQYLMLAQGVGYMVDIHHGRETVAEQFPLADVEQLEVVRKPNVLTLRFNLHGQARRIDLANDKLVTFRDPAFPAEEGEPAPLTMAEQAVLYIEERAVRARPVADVA